MDPGILRGQPCITGTRISVEFILELLSLGYSIGDFLDDYLQLTQKQIFAVLDFTRECIRSCHAPCVNTGLDDKNII
jgi:uncharacterized protein (DUF433 family)